MAFENKVERCGTIHPSYSKYRCERFGKCGKDRTHVAVDRSGSRKAQLIEFDDEGDIVRDKKGNVIKKIQGDLF